MSNFVFSRRYLQQCISALEEVLPSPQIDALIARLNRKGTSDRLAAMWELVVLRCISTAGSLQYERALRRGRKPDFRLKLPKVTVIGDIATVSDAGLHKANPLETLTDEIVRLAKKHKLNPNHFSYRVEGAQTGEYPKKARMSLALSDKRSLLEVCKRELVPFMSQISRNDLTESSIFVNASGNAFAIKYDETQTFFGGGHLSYTVALSLEANPIASALAEKSKQLASAPLDSIRAVILCDGGCNLLAEPWKPAASYGRQAIVRDYLRRHSSLDVVVTVRVDERGFGRDVRRTMGINFEHAPMNMSRRMKKTTISAAKWKTRRILSRISRGDADVDLAAEAATALANALQTLPKPWQSASNAARQSKLLDFGPDGRGGLVMTGRSIRISTRALVGLLAGEIDQRSFLASYGWGLGDRERENPFAEWLKAGRMISEAKVVRREERDDDWIELIFGDPDPAVAKFVRRQGPP